MQAYTELDIRALSVHPRGMDSDRRTQTLSDLLQRSDMGRLDPARARAIAEDALRRGNSEAPSKELIDGE